MSKSLVSAETLAAVGTSRPLRSGVVTAQDIRKYCVSIDEMGTPHLDEEAARKAGFSNVIAPPLFPIAVTRPIVFESHLLPDGQYDDLAPPGLQNLQSMLAGQEWEIFRPAVVGETLTEQVSFGAITEKPGRSGSLVFVGEDSIVRDAKGAPVLRLSNTLLFREPPPRTAAMPPSTRALDASTKVPSSYKDGVLTRNPTMISLFMYTAVTWSVHRTHYDVLYAQSEGLPSAVLPGAMISAYFCQFVQARFPTNTLKKLTLKFMAPACPGDTFTLSMEGPADPANVGMAMRNQDNAVVASGTASCT